MIDNLCIIHIITMNYVLCYTDDGDTVDIDSAVLVQQAPTVTILAVESDGSDGVSGRGYCVSAASQGESDGCSTSCIYQVTWAMCTVMNIQL